MEPKLSNIDKKHFFRKISNCLAILLMLKSTIIWNTSC